MPKETRNETPSMARSRWRCLQQLQHKLHKPKQPQQTKEQHNPRNTTTTNNNSTTNNNTNVNNTNTNNNINSSNLRSKQEAMSPCDHVCSKSRATAPHVLCNRKYSLEGHSPGFIPDGLERIHSSIDVLNVPNGVACNGAVHHMQEKHMQETHKTN